MKTINISLPAQLKTQAETLISQGYFASFSDIVRTSLREMIQKKTYDLYLREAKQELKNGKASVIENKEDVRSVLDANGE